MKKKTLLIGLLMCLLVISAGFAQRKPDKLKKVIGEDPKENFLKDINHDMLYTIKSKYIVHSYELMEEGKTKEKGKVFRKILQHGLYETFYIMGDREMLRIAYWSDPTAMITTDINKSEYCVYSDKFSVLYPFIMRGIASVLKEGKEKKMFKGIEVRFEKQSSFQEKGLNLTRYYITTQPKVFSGTVVCLNSDLILKGNLTIYNENAERKGLKGLFIPTGVSESGIYNFTFLLDYFDKREPDPFYEIDLDHIIKHFEKIECEKE